MQGIDLQTDTPSEIQDTKGDGVFTCGRFRLTGEMNPWTTFCEGRPDLEGARSYYDRLYRRNYGRLLPEDKRAEILVTSAGIGYFVKFLNDLGYQNVLGIDSDLKKIEYARQSPVPVRVERENTFDFLEDTDRRFDLIVAEQEVNHLTKRELVIFLIRARARLKPGGHVIFNSTNYANPFTAIDHWAHNFNHYTGYTDNSVVQILDYCGFGEAKCLPIDNYVFYTNPLNWVAKLFTGLVSLGTWALYKLYGKDAYVFTKRMIAVGTANGEPRESGI